MIPVLGVPVLNRPDLLYKMLASVDVQVGQVIVIDNSSNGANVENLICPGAMFVAPHMNLGVAASWNFIIRSFPNASWWAIVNSDIVFAPGDLAKLAETMETRGEMAFLRTPSVIGISPETIEKTGYFDENFYPAYYEDNDYVYRAGLTGTTISVLPAGYEHEQSATIRSDTHLWAENQRTFPINGEYYVRKWGGTVYQERFSTPFNAGGSPKDWTLDETRITELTWK